MIAIDIDPKKIDYAHHNAAIYGVDDRIDFIKGDFFDLAPKLKVLKQFSMLYFVCLGLQNAFCYALLDPVFW